MPESQKLKRLRELRALVTSGKLDPKKTGRQIFEDTDGSMVRLSDEGAGAALDRRIAAEEAEASEEEHG